MDVYPLVIKGFIFSLSLCFDLGLVNVAIVRTGIERGFRKSLWVGLGSCLGDLIYLMLALFGLSLFFELPFVRWTLWGAGTVFLLYLAYGMIRETIRPRKSLAAQEEVESSGRARYFVRGAALALSSPSSIVWFAMMTGPILATVEVKNRSILLLFAAGFLGAGILWSVTMAALSSRAGQKLGSRFVRVISAISAVIFVLLALKVFTDGLRQISG
jgi:L-lysine exporter family protein LysE/ArgO